MRDEIMQFDVEINREHSFSEELNTILEFISVIDRVPEFDVAVVTALEYEVEL